MRIGAGRFVSTYTPDQSMKLAPDRIAPMHRAYLPGTYCLASAPRGRIVYARIRLSPESLYYPTHAKRCSPQPGEAIHLRSVHVPANGDAQHNVYNRHQNQNPEQSALDMHRLPLSVVWDTSPASRCIPARPALAGLPIPPASCSHPYTPVYGGEACGLSSRCHALHAIRHAHAAPRED